MNSMEIATSLDHQNNPRSSSCCQPQQQRRGCRWVGLSVVAGALGLLVPLGVLGNNVRKTGLSSCRSKRKQRNHHLHLRRQQLKEVRSASAHSMIIITM